MAHAWYGLASNGQDVAVFHRGEHDPPLPARIVRFKENFAQDIVYDTGVIRSELGYREQIPERDAMRDVCLSSPGASRG